MLDEDPVFVVEVFLQIIPERGFIADQDDLVANVFLDGLNGALYLWKRRFVASKSV